MHEEYNVGFQINNYPHNYNIPVFFVAETTMYRRSKAVIYDGLSSQ